MLLFEDQPLLLVPLILVTVVCHDLVKHVLLRMVRQAGYGRPLIRLASSKAGE